ncbi:MAG: hypothetical protein ABIL25_05115 [candidate division WOR-3 bacterium]
MRVIEAGQAKRILANLRIIPTITNVAAYQAPVLALDIGKVVLPVHPDRVKRNLCSSANFASAWLINSLPLSEWMAVAGEGAARRMLFIANITQM